MRGRSKPDFDQVGRGGIRRRRRAVDLFDQPATTAFRRTGGECDQLARERPTGARAIRFIRRERYEQHTIAACDPRGEVAIDEDHARACRS